MWASCHVLLSTLWNNSCHAFPIVLHCKANKSFPLRFLLVLIWSQPQEKFTAVTDTLSLSIPLFPMRIAPTVTLREGLMPKWLKNLEAYVYKNYSFDFYHLVIRESTSVCSLLCALYHASFTTYLLSWVLYHVFFTMYISPYVLCHASFTIFVIFMNHSSYWTVGVSCLLPPI